MKKVYMLEDLDCAHCAAKMEDAIKELDGVVNATVSFLSQKLTIEVSDTADLDAIMKKVVKVCRKVEPDCTIVMK